MLAAELAPLLKIDQPYPGLRSFEPQEAHLFHGRETHTRELLTRLTGERFIAVVGTSGSGKSSLVRAGLIPALRGGFLPGASSSWRVAMMKPGDAPLDRLAEALKEAGIQAANLRETLAASDLGLVNAVRGAKIDENLLLVVDQFEEIFRFARTRGAEDGGAEASQFVASLLEAAGVFSPSIYVVLTMRSDFLGECTRYSGLPEAMNRGQYLVPRLTRDQLRDAIVNPLRLVRAPIDPRLVERLLNEAGNEPDQLPVLQHALNRTFHIWNGAAEPLGFDHYERAGTMEHALDRHAEALLEGLPVELTERVFRCLTTTEGGRAVRRPERLSRIERVVGASVGVIVERFAGTQDCLLICSPGDDPVVDISHERLIPLWKRLSQWVESEARCLDLYCRAAADVSRYPAEASLWRGPELKSALGYLESRLWSAEWAAASLPESKQNVFSPVEGFVLEGKRAEQHAEQLAELQRRKEADDAKALAEAAEMRAAAEAERRRIAEELARTEAEAREVERSRKRWVLAAGVIVAAALGLAVYSQTSVTARLEAERKRLTDAFLAEAQEKRRISDASERLLKIELEERDLRARDQTAEIRRKLAQLAEERTRVQREKDALEAKFSAGRTLINPVDNLTYVWIPPGRFRMGCSPDDKECYDDEKPAHDVEILRGFWLGETEVTQAAWQKVMGSSPSNFKGDQLPVEQVSWTEANQYCGKVGGRLPTEAEWEYAARGGTAGARYGELESIAWFADNSGKQRLDSAKIWREEQAKYGEKVLANGNSTKPVRGKLANPFGLYDMLGNVWEWTADWYGPYGEQAVRDPKGPSTGDKRSLRGGSWYNYPQAVRSSLRFRNEVELRLNNIGFRCAGEFR